MRSENQKPTVVAAPESGPVRIGVIGAGGRILEVLKRLFSVAPWARINALCDPDAAAAARMRKELAPDAALCGTAAELCARDDVDWVFIGSWNSLHAEHCVTAFQGGKDVFCEKPLALSLTEAELMHAAWKGSKRRFALGLVLRYSPLYRFAKTAIDSGQIGHILSFEFNETLSFNHGGYIHGNWRRHSRHVGSYLLEKCCHDLDLAMWLVSDRPARVASFGGCTFFTPKNQRHQSRIGPGPNEEIPFEAWPDAHRVNPFTADKDIVDHQVAILDFASGVRATFHTHCMASLRERRFYMVGSEGVLRLDAYTGQIELRRVGWREEKQVSHPVAEGGGHAGGDDIMCVELAECLAGRRAPAAGFADGVRSLVLAQAMDDARHAGVVVDLAAMWSRADAMMAEP